MLSEEQKQEIEGLDECKLYFAIDSIGDFIWRMNHNASHGRVEITEGIQKDLELMFEYQQYALQQLIKFGVAPESAKDRPDGDYWKWYGHWDNWKKEMSNEVWRNFDRKMSKDEDYSDMLPKEGWNK